MIASKQQIYETSEGKQIQRNQVPVSKFVELPPKPRVDDFIHALREVQESCDLDARTEEEVKQININTAFSGQFFQKYQSFFKKLKF